MNLLHLVDFFRGFCLFIYDLYVLSAKCFKNRLQPLLSLGHGLGGLPLLLRAGRKP